MSSDARPEPPALSPEQQWLLIQLFRQALHRVVDAEIDAGASPAEVRETLAERRRLLESLIAEDPATTGDSPSRPPGRSHAGADTTAGD